MLLLERAEVKHFRVPDCWINCLMKVTGMHCVVGATTYTCMANKDGGVEADITVSVLEKGDGSSVIKPQFEGNGR